MSKFYYLVASLPALVFGKDHGMARPVFFEECGKWLSEEELKTLRSADITRVDTIEAKAPVLEKWSEFNARLRSEIISAREEWSKTGTYKAAGQLKEILDKKNPLVIEKLIEKLRWDFLEGMELGYFFDLNWLIIYSMKLQMLERIKSFDKDKGEDIYDKLCEVNHEKANR